MNNRKANDNWADSLREELEQLRAENTRLRRKKKDALQYIREKTDQLLTVIGTVPLKPDELDDKTLLELDPIGIVSNSFSQILDHQKTINLELESAREEIEAIFDSVGEGIMVLNDQGKIVAHNRKMSRLFAPGFSEILGKTCRKAVCAGETSQDNCLLRKVVSRKKSVRMRSWQCRNRVYEIIGTPVFDKTGAMKRVVILYMDITRRKKTEAALQESEARFRDLFENATDILMSTDPTGCILLVNKAWQDALGYDRKEAETLTLYDIIAPEHLPACRKNFKKILKDGREFSCQTVFVRKNGAEIIVDGRVNCRFVDGKPVSLRCIFRDITEQRRMQEEMQRTQKLESVGMLAGGIAHDFNNLLTGIIGNIHLARLQSPDKGMTRLLDASESASQRAQELTRQLLTFAKGGAPVKETASVAEIIEEVASFALRGSNTHWQLEIEEPVSPVDVDTGQFSQVLQNLIINSDQAMPDGGMIHISVADCTVDDTIPMPLADGRYVKIDIRDQGIGIAREYLSRIFDPYFSTKRKGSGLGLATSYSIIRNHNGLITVDSEPGNGTTMSILLPASKAEVVRKKLLKQQPVPGQGRLLVMDDDETVRKVAAQMLSHLGYDVTESDDGADTVAQYNKALEENRPFDAVILDLTIPGGMGGRETVARLAEIDPQVTAIVSSGYSNDPIMADYALHGFAGVVPKPYSLVKLSSVVSSALTAAGKNSPNPLISQRT